MIDCVANVKAQLNLLYQAYFGASSSVSDRLRLHSGHSPRMLTQNLSSTNPSPVKSADRKLGCGRSKIAEAALEVRMGGDVAVEACVVPIDINLKGDALLDE